MKVESINDSLIIVPETEFETEWLHKYPIGEVFHKIGNTASNYIGLKIRRKSLLPTRSQCAEPGQGE